MDKKGRIIRGYALVMLIAFSLGYFVGAYPDTCAAAPPKVSVEPEELSDTTIERVDEALSTYSELLSQVEGIPVGEFKITAYTAGYESCGKLPDDPLYGITATGVEVQPFHTIATDWDVLPPGTHVRIEGFPCVFVVEDKGGAVKGQHIDVYMQELSTALDWGVQYRQVYLLEELVE